MKQTRERPLAPAPLPVLAGVAVVVALLLWAAATRFHNDWAAVFACLAVLAVASVALDRSGRAEAKKHPHPLWYDQRLPYEKSILKNVLVLVVLLLVLLTAIKTSVQDYGEKTFGNPYPYFLAAGFLYLIVPQVFARKIRRSHDRTIRSG